MPQATDELREEMNKLFGDSISDVGPRTYLLCRGFTEKSGLIQHPTKRWPDFNIIEMNCIQFLCDEWDYAFEETIKTNNKP